GDIVGGVPIGLALMKLAAIAIFVPLLIYPWRIGGIYLTGLKKSGIGLQYGISYFYMGFYWVSRFLGRWLVTAVYAVRSTGLLSRFSAAAQSSKSAPPEPAADSFSCDESPDDSDEILDDSESWPQDAPGALPKWAANEPPKGVRSRSGVSGVKKAGSKWSIPSTDCLTPATPRELSEGPLQEMGRQVETALAEHGVMVEVKDIKAGPRIVRFGLVPGWTNRRGDGSKEDGNSGKMETRVKVQSILTREKDLALTLKTPYLRIEAPVPGEALVGLEVPAPTPNKVHLREVMESPDFRKISEKGGLPVALGQDTGGTSVVTDLAGLPHLLIAGATGSGKSVCLNSVVASLILTKPPDQLRMVMVDPKRVELTPFNGIPHLAIPVIVDVDEVNSALRGMMREMFRRYKLMEEIGVRNIAGYNEKSKERMPFLVLIVDELADLMITGGFEVEQNLVRLAQLGRATGIHLVLATQRPSVNVVTGLLKANIPGRIAFAVASQVDSRVILDVVGAERLLGKGDMLILNSDSPKPRRVQGTLVYDNEIEEMVKFWSNQKGGPLPDIMLDDEIDEDDENEEANERMLAQARELALRSPRMSTSFLERRFKVGQQKAEQIMEHLEEEGLVIPR
ncbi:MAG: DNA translocase FtsK, partial [Chloroflexota bacterium]|nr:DNA translocase FtsK [Chloroflexota bacterium]